MPDFAALPPLALGAIFLVAAVLVWIAGTRLASYVGLLADRIGLSGAAAGLLILGVITSLPEVATSTTAAWRGDAHLAAGDVLGSVTLQVVVLAIADAMIGRRALTTVVPSPQIQLQANMGVILLILAAAGVIVGDRAVFGVGLWPIVIALLFLTTPLLMRAVSRRDDPEARAARAEMERLKGLEHHLEGKDASVPVLVGKIALVAVVICVAGFGLASSGQQLARITGLGSSFFGTVFLAAATSLPELSSAVAAARLNRPDLAVGDILGSNMVNLAMLLLVDGVYQGDAIFNELEPFSAVSAMLAAVLTAIFMIGLVERRDRSVLRMGYDSLAVMAVYAAGLVVLYNMS